MSYLDRKTADAAALGSTRAEREFHAGAAAPTGGPLSGEWAGDMTPADLADRLDIRDEFDIDAACSAYEDAYLGTWDAMQSAVS